tara:strand:+ start:605 stop:1066 length:462 start_codon:yes stop_codon:yes gene_type:complete
MGLPAAGKSSVSIKMFSNYKIIDCDSIKEAHPEYNASKPFILHAWSKSMVQGQFEAVLSLGRQNVIYDTTGTNAPRMSRQMMQAKRAGFKVSLLFVTCPLSVSIERNALRPRVVPAHIIEEKAHKVSNVFHLIKHMADSVQVVDNSTFNQDLA